MCSFCGIYLLIGVMVTVITSGDSATTHVHLGTHIGNVTGINKTVTFLGKKYYSSQFLGIPYAEPPTGNRRFQRPKLYSAYHAEYNATYHRPHCMQSATAYKLMKYFTMSEDCLYLNIYKPGKTTSDSSTYPVMVFIHGGSFSFGGADIFSGEVISSVYDVVVVTLNYRLNAFGFLSDGTKYSGNLGLLDQKLALKWINDNIEQFGGNKAEVTLFGSSSGAASILFQATNPSNRGLFKRIIAQSGSFLAPWAIQRNPKQHYDGFVKDAGCSSAADVMRCLREKPANVLAVIAEKYIFAPVVDGDFIEIDPANLNNDNSSTGAGILQLFSELDFLSGVTSKEGATAFDSFGEDLEKLNINLTEGFPRDLFETVFVPMLLSQTYGENVSKSIQHSIIHEYSAWPNPNDPISVRDCVIHLSSDSSFVAPALQNAILHSKIKHSNLGTQINRSSTYFYVFDAKTKFDPEPTWLDGAKHTMELPFVFGFPDPMKLAIDLSPDEKLNLPNDEAFLSHATMMMWTNFAKIGDPNSIAWRMTSIPTWQTFNQSTQNYMELSLNMTSDSSKSHLAPKRMDFWTNVFPRLHACVVCTPEARRTGNAASASRATLLCLLVWLPLVYMVTM